MAKPGSLRYSVEWPKIEERIAVPIRLAKQSSSHKSPGSDWTSSPDGQTNGSKSLAPVQDTGRDCRQSVVTDN